MKLPNHIPYAGVILISLSLLAGCNGSKSSTKPISAPASTPTAIDIAPSDLVGVWDKAGYGQILKIESDVTYDYQVSTNTCLLNNEFLAQELDSVLVEVTLAADKKSFKTKQEHIPDHAHAYTFNKLDALPSACQSENILSPTLDSALNYKVLWDTFNDYYAFFEVRDVDWNSVNDAASPALEQNLDEAGLFELFKQMLSPLKDGHIHISSEEYNIQWSAGFRPAWFERIIGFFQQNFPEDELRQGFAEQSEINNFETYVNAIFGQNYQALDQKNTENIQSYLGDIFCAANNHICWGDTQSNVGYLSIDAMQDYVADADEQDNAADLTVLATVMDEAFVVLSATDALIIDLRKNQGGQESISLKIAGRFVEQEQLSYRKQSRNKQTLANSHDIYLKPIGNNAYTNPVYVLISGGTYSGAETFALSMKGLPNVTLIGEPSGGIFSDMISKQLPNGWNFTMSTEIYSDLDGNVYESIGLPVDHHVEFLVPEEVLAGADTAIDKALGLILSQ